MRLTKKATRYESNNLGTVVILLAIISPLAAIFMPAPRTDEYGIIRSTPPDTRPDVQTMLETVDQFNIGAAPLSTELGELLDDRQLNYIYSFSDLSAIRGNPIRGRVSLRAALQQMLDSTGCSYRPFETLIEISCKPRGSLNENELRAKQLDAAP